MNKGSSPSLGGTVKELSNSDKSIRPERGALRNALAKAILEVQAIEPEILQIRKQAADLKGQMAMFQEDLVEVEATLRGKEKRLANALSEQVVLGTLFLGKDGRSLSNPDGLTLQQAVTQDMDGLKEAITK